MATEIMIIQRNAYFMFKKLFGNLEAMLLDQDIVKSSQKLGEILEQRPFKPRPPTTLLLVPWQNGHGVQVSD